MQDVALYDVVEPKEDVWASFGYKDIFTNSRETRAQGMKENACKSFQVVSEGSHSGEDHLHLQWDQSKGCKYIGMGFLWKDYRGKDLSGIYENAAIELYMRVDSGWVTAVPMFFVLSDYTGRHCRSKVNILDIEGGRIGTSWTRVRVPLQSFRPERKGVNLSNIKELRIEFQRQGDVHVDDIRVVPHTHLYALEASTSEYRVNGLPMAIGCGREHWWGINEKVSNHFRFGEADSGHGRVSETVMADVDVTGPKPWNSFGFAFHEWLSVDLSDHCTSAAIQFKVQGESIPPMQMMCFSYAGAKRRIQKRMTKANFRSVGEGEWEVRVPLKSFPGFQDLGWDALKELRFKVLKSGSFHAGEFELIEFRGNPKKPFKWKAG